MTKEVSPSKEESVVTTASYWLGYWQEVLGLQNLWIELGLRNTKNRMEVSWLPNEYYRILVKVSPKIELNEIPRAALHELCHFLQRDTFDFVSNVLSDSLMDELQKRDELVTDVLSRIIWRLHYADKSPPEPHPPCMEP